MDFLFRNQETRKIKPRQLVQFIRNESEKITNAEIDEAAFQEELSKSGNRSIIFVDVIGQSQVGKTSTIKALTRNNGHKIGNGITEETIGVTIDGPYEMEELFRNQGIQLSTVMNKSAPLVYFLDIEGYGGFSKGQNLESVIKIYQKFAVPFCGISGVHIILVNEKEGQQSFEIITETLHLSDLCTNSNSYISSNIIIGVTNVQKKPFGKDFTYPNRESSDAIAKKFTNSFQANNFLRDISYVIRPLPYIDPMEPDEKEIERFIPAFHLFVEDILKQMECSFQSPHVRDSEAILEHFRRIRSSISNMSGMKEAFEQSLMTQGEQTVQRQVKFAIIEAMKTSNDKLNEVFEKAIRTNDRMKLNSMIEQIRAQMIEDVDSYLPPGIRYSDALFEAKKQLINEYDDICSKKNSELLIRLTPSCLSQASTFGYQEISRQREIFQNRLMNRDSLAQTLQNRNGVIDQVSKLVLDATNQFIGQILGDKFAELQEPISQVLETLRSTVASELNNQLDQAVTQFTVHNSNFEYEKDPNDERYINVYQIVTETDPSGHEKKERVFICRSFEKPEPGFFKTLGEIVLTVLPFVLPLFKSFIGPK